jgi:uridine monophosphate synthetase
MQQQLILDLFEHQMIKSGQFTLKSGKQSYIYADIRTAISYPAIFKQICDQFYQMLQNLSYDFICGVPYSALTFASGIAYAHNIPMLLKRKEAKEYGTKKILEGNYKPGQTCILLEDVITTGASLLETIQVLAEHGLIITDICTLIDREQGGRKHLEEIGYQVHSIMSLRQIIEVLEQTGRISLADKHHALALMKE